MLKCYYNYMYSRKLDTKINEDQTSKRKELRSKLMKIEHQEKRTRAVRTVIFHFSVVKCSQQRRKSQDLQADRQECLQRKKCCVKTHNSNTALLLNYNTHLFKVHTQMD